MNYEAYLEKRRQDPDTRLPSTVYRLLPQITRPFDRLAPEPIAHGIERIL